MCSPSAQSRMSSFREVLHLTAVVSPMKQGLALASAARQVARLAVTQDLPYMTAHGFPALDLARILLGQPPAHVIPAIPLEPAARVVAVNPAFSAPKRQGLAGINTKVVEGTVAPARRQFRALKPIRWKFFSAIGHVFS